MMHGGGGGPGTWRAFMRHEDGKKADVTWDLLKRVMKYARPYTRIIAAVLSIIIIISLIELIPPLLYRDLFDKVIPDKDYNRLNLLAIGMIGIPVATNLLGVAQRYFSARMGEGIIFDLRNEMYRHLQGMALRFFTHTKSGEIISRFNSDVVGAQGAVTNTLPSIITNTITLVTTLAIMLTIEWRLALLSVIVFPLFVLPARRVGRTLRNLRRSAMEYNADMSSQISETLSINGSMLVKIFGRQKAEKDKFENFSGKVRDIGVRRATVGRWFFMGMGIATTIGTALIYWVGGRLVLDDAITAGTIVAFVAYIGRLYMPLTQLTNVQVEFITSMVSFERVFEYLDLEQEIVDTPNPVHLEKAKGAIRFEDVCFSYLMEEDWQRIARRKQKRLAESNGDKQEGSKNQKMELSLMPTRRTALHDLDFSIEPGQLVALVGPSGAGKTTVTYLLPRLYDPTSGRITLDGHDLRDLSLESLTAQMGMVTQETYLFHDTIRANLQYANPAATDADLKRAATAANIHDFIDELPEGYDTLVGERGYRLSGGEKQRLAIARVILKDPRILILDEATSHLDSQSESLIQAALEPLLENRTSVVIAHRLSTILRADQILVMEDGRLVEQGTHTELLQAGGLYEKLYETQFGGMG